MNNSKDEAREIASTLAAFIIGIGGRLDEAKKFEDLATDKIAILIQAKNEEIKRLRLALKIIEDHANGL